jgi:hypothetical protein
MSFRYSSADNQTAFRCNLRCLRCTALKPNGQRCNRTTCKVLPMCTQHLKVHGLEIKPSGIPQAGLGLFTLIPRQANEIICVYDGEHMTKAQLDARYGDENATAPYAIHFDDLDEYVDAACQRYTPAYVNQGERKKGRYANVTLITKEDDHSIVLKATRYIAANRELFVDYGEAYWQGDTGHYVTKPYKLKSLM